MTDQAMLPGMENALPLFSGTPQRVTRKDPAPATNVPVAGQSSYATCHLCKDTGRLNTGGRMRYCW